MYRNNTAGSGLRRARALGEAAGPGPCPPPPLFRGDGVSGPDGHPEFLAAAGALDRAAQRLELLAVPSTSAARSSADRRALHRRDRHRQPVGARLPSASLLGDHARVAATLGVREPGFLWPGFLPLPEARPGWGTAPPAPCIEAGCLLLRPEATAGVVVWVRRSLGKLSRRWGVSCCCAAWRATLLTVTRSIRQRTRRSRPRCRELVAFVTPPEQGAIAHERGGEIVAAWSREGALRLAQLLPPAYEGLAAAIRERHQ
jgi:hypothetical protein